MRSAFGQILFSICLLLIVLDSFQTNDDQEQEKIKFCKVNLPYYQNRLSLMFQRQFNEMIGMARRNYLADIDYWRYCIEVTRNYQNNYENKTLKDFQFVRDNLLTCASLMTIQSEKKHIELMITETSYCDAQLELGQNMTHVFQWFIETNHFKDENISKYCSKFKANINNINGDMKTRYTPDSETPGFCYYKFDKLFEFLKELIEISHEAYQQMFRKRLIKLKLNDDELEKIFDKKIKFPTFIVNLVKYKQQMKPKQEQQPNLQEEEEENVEDDLGQIPEEEQAGEDKPKQDEDNQENMDNNDDNDDEIDEPDKDDEDDEDDEDKQQLKIRNMNNSNQSFPDLAINHSKYLLPIKHTTFNLIGSITIVALYGVALFATGYLSRSVLSSSSIDHLSNSIKNNESEIDTNTTTSTASNLLPPLPMISIGVTIAVVVIYFLIQRMLMKNQNSSKSKQITTTPSGNNSGKSSVDDNEATINQIDNQNSPLMIKANNQQMSKTPSQYAHGPGSKQIQQQQQKPQVTPSKYGRSNVGQSQVTDSKQHILKKSRQKTGQKGLPPHHQVPY